MLPDAETSTKKSTPSYIAMISQAILSAHRRCMLLSEIYNWISLNYPTFKQEDRSWRNSIRHNLSLNECFVKSGRSDCGKGHYWSIHRANIVDFGRGDYRRRRARQLVKKLDYEQRAHQNDADMSDVQSLDTNVNYEDCRLAGYVPMAISFVPIDELVELVGIDACLTKTQQIERETRREAKRTFNEYAEQYTVDLDFYDNM